MSLRPQLMSLWPQLMSLRPAETGVNTVFILNHTIKAKHISLQLYVDSLDHMPYVFEIRKIVSFQEKAIL